MSFLPRGAVTKTYKAEDNVRVVDIRTAHAIYRRPSQKDFKI